MDPQESYHVHQILSDGEHTLLNTLDQVVTIPSLYVQAERLMLLKSKGNTVNKAGDTKHVKETKQQQINKQTKRQICVPIKGLYRYLHYFGIYLF
jgi:hypothetical protein